MELTIPDGRVLRPPTEADARAVAALLRARDVADLGEPEARVADVRAEWEPPWVDLGADARVVESGDGGLAAYMLVSGDDIVVAIHPGAAGTGLGGALLAEAERVARARGTRVARQFVPAANDAARALLLEAGWWPVHHYFRMEIALEDAAPPPPVLARPFVPEQDAEPVWHLIQGCYADVEGHLQQPLEGWRASALGKPGWDPRLWLLLHDADGIAGVALGDRSETAPKSRGVVTTLAVAERARGRGHGRALLLLLLDAFRREGMRAAEAAVHGPTAAAARVFESAGMTAARRHERWEKVLGD